MLNNNSYKNYYQMLMYVVTDINEINDVDTYYLGVVGRYIKSSQLFEEKQILVFFSRKKLNVSDLLI